MRIELLPYSIRVTLLNPGAVNTEFSEVRFRGDKDRANKVYNGFQPLTAEDIAECAFFCTQLPDHVNINDMLVMPTAQANAILFNKKHQ
jgi:NADP-dependent 3-hydroxy acid dehydrogenase YdfG